MQHTNKPYNPDDLQQAVKTLREGGLILYPTDTIWGIGCDATNQEAVSRVYALKQRIETKSMLVLVDTVNRVASYVNTLPDVAYDMMELTDKPLTLILDGAKNLAKNLVAEDGSIGIRVTNETFSHDLCRTFNRPIVSTSANISGSPSATLFSQIEQQIKDGVDYIVNYRQDETTPKSPSSIIKLKENGQVTIIRP